MCGDTADTSKLCEGLSPKGFKGGGGMGGGLNRRGIIQGVI